ncbi:MAG TPA: 30S ribosome-binding factor RbfA [Gammaproteobacteria bacterium]|nr:30S ribosome-binding factor RbfA [Gammaproteobacteria bacterium]
MPKDFSRTRRIGLQIQRDLADLIRTQLKDPRVGMISVNAVKVSRDLSHAKVYITTLDDGKRESTLSVLSGAAGFLQHELAQRLSIRHIPHLHFVYDDSIENGSRLTSLIEDAVSADRRNHQADE